MYKYECIKHAHISMKAYMMMCS